MATSFYNEGDEALAPFLAALLVENNQTIPDFLEEYAPPADQPLNFDDDSGDEVDNFGVEDTINTDNAGGSWGGGNAQTADAAGGSWGNGSDDVAGVSKVEPKGDTWGTGTSNDFGGASW